MLSHLKTREHIDNFNKLYQKQVCLIPSNSKMYWNINSYFFLSIIKIAYFNHVDFKGIKSLLESIQQQCYPSNIGGRIHGSTMPLGYIISLM